VEIFGQVFEDLLTLSVARRTCAVDCLILSVKPHISLGQPKVEMVNITVKGDIRVNIIEEDIAHDGSKMHKCKSERKTSI
jgi:hypothetical protein